MSVEIYNTDENDTKICLAVSGEEFFNEIWANALGDLQITRLGNGIYLYKEDLPDILNDFLRIKQWSESNLSGEDLANIVSHIDTILDYLPKQWAENDDIPRPWMG